MWGCCSIGPNQRTAFLPSFGIAGCFESHITSAMTHALCYITNAMTCCTCHERVHCQPRLCWQLDRFWDRFWTVNCLFEGSLACLVTWHMCMCCSCSSLVSCVCGLGGFIPGPLCFVSSRVAHAVSMQHMLVLQNSSTESVRDCLH